METKKEESGLGQILVARELSPEEIAECARVGRWLRQKMQERIDRVQRIPPEAWDMMWGATHIRIPQHSPAFPRAHSRPRSNIPRSFFCPVFAIKSNYCEIQP